MSTDEFAAAFPFRLRQVESGLKDLISWRGKVDTERATQVEQLKTMDAKLDSLSASVDSLRKTLVGLSVSIAVGSVGFALSVLIATGKI